MKREDLKTSVIWCLNKTASSKIELTPPPNNCGFFFFLKKDKILMMQIVAAGSSSAWDSKTDRQQEDVSPN